MTERRTNKELADALESKAKWDTPHEQTFLREAAQRLLDMPEGERIEVWATREHDAWVLNENRPHAIARPATLILHERKEGDG